VAGRVGRAFQGFSIIIVLWFWEELLLYSIQRPKVTPTPKTLLITTALLVGGLLLFRHGWDEEVRDYQDNTLQKPFTAENKSPLTNPFQNKAQKNQQELTASIVQQSGRQENAREASQTPLQLIDAYMTAWSGDNRLDIDRLWEEIKQCQDCLERMKELLMNQAVPKGMLLEWTYQLIALGDENLLPVFDYLLQPYVDLNTRIIVSQQMIKDGRGMYVKKLFDILQQADFDGYKDYADKQVWMISKLSNPEGIAPIFDVISGRSGASESFSNHVRDVFNNTLLGIKQEGMDDAMANYYLSASETEQAKLWSVVSLHSQTLVVLSVDAYQNGATDHFQKYSQAMAGVNSLDAVEGLLELRSQVDYSQDYFSEMINRLTQRYHNMETLHKFEDYLRDPQKDLNTRLLAADGLLAVKESEQARYILQKAIDAAGYGDAEIVAYIHSRL